MRQSAHGESTQAVFPRVRPRVSRGFAKGVAGTVSLPIFSVFIRFLPFLLFFRVPIFSVFFRFFFRFLPFFFRFFPFFSVFFRFFRFFPFFFRFIFRKKRGDTVRETPFAKPRVRVHTKGVMQQHAALRSTCS